MPRVYSIYNIAADFQNYCIIIHYLLPVRHPTRVEVSMQRKLNAASNRAATLELRNQGLSQRKINMVLGIRKPE